METLQGFGGGRGDCSQAHNAHSLQVIPFGLLDTSAPSPLPCLSSPYTSLAYLAVSCLIRHVMCHVMMATNRT